MRGCAFDIADRFSGSDHEVADRADALRCLVASGDAVCHPQPLAHVVRARDCSTVGVETAFAIFSGAVVVLGGADGAHARRGTLVLVAAIAGSGW